jgi:hypothetical protein
VFGPLTRRATQFINEGLRRAQEIDCFDFIPSNYRVFHAVLAALPRGRFCEWGSGMGIATGLAEMLGFTAHGIEIDAPLAAASRRLLADFGLSATIDTGDYLQIDHPADVYFTYCWPSRMPAAEQRFLSAAPQHAQLLICHGAEDIRRKVKQSC